MAMNTILAVDDDPDIRKLIERIFGKRYRVLTAEGGEKALSLNREETPDCILLDIDMPGMDGMETLDHLQKETPGIPVIMLSGLKEVETAIRSLKQGAYDFLTKPPDFDALEKAIARAIERTALLTEVRRLRGEIHRIYGIENIVGRHPRMLEVFETVGRIAPRQTTVLISGESGTGKELVARAIYRHGSRADGPFVAVNCAAVPDSLFEAEFFGHEQGAFTDAKRARTGYFEQASGGTLFLDEVGDLNLVNQAKILRVLQDHEVTRLGGGASTPVDVRVLCATNQDLDQLVEEGAFRQDLYYRINVIPIRMPPLREHTTDIPLLAGHFVSRIADRENERPKTLRPGTIERLQSYPWPGNVRELENLVERLMATVGGDEILPEHLPEKITDARVFRDSALHHMVLSGDISLVEAVSRFESEVIDEALQRSEGNKSAAAGLIGITRRMLGYKLDRPPSDEGED